MTSILGIDAAWTVTNPSGVALVPRGASGWILTAVGSSYQTFLAQADPSKLYPSGSQIDAAALLRAAEVLAHTSVDLVAVDMPVSRLAIVGRRVSDNAVSRAYGARHCSTHTPNAIRPGRVGLLLHDSFSGAGYPLQTNSLATPGLIEVYPHPALVELASAAKRLPYKVSKIGKYWPTLSGDERREQLYAQWKSIVSLLDREIGGVQRTLPIPATDAACNTLKAFENTLDSVVCAWVGICAIENRAFPFGDSDSAIWIPSRLLATLASE
jgi:predicted RNase H-like nuclease